MKESIIQTEKECYFCHTTLNLHCHHVFEGTANRKVSENNGFKVWLCAEHHNMSNNSVHHNKDMDLILKKLFQKEYEKEHSREEFIKLIGRNYIDE